MSYKCNRCNEYECLELRLLIQHLSRMHNVDKHVYKKSKEYRSLLKRELLRLSEKDDNDCLIWKGYKFPDGYGGYCTKRVHRISYDLFVALIDPQKLICHKCDKPLCINPTHLYQGTPQDNMNDMKKRGRSLKGDLNPSKRIDVRQKIAKEWIITFPTGKEIVIKNLYKFCSENNMKYRSLCEKGKWKGTVCKRK